MNEGFKSIQLYLTPLPILFDFFLIIMQPIQFSGTEMNWREKNKVNSQISHWIYDMIAAFFGEFFFFSFDGEWKENES